VLRISGWPYRVMAACTASTQQSLVNVLDSLRDNARRLVPSRSAQRDTPLEPHRNVDDIDGLHVIRSRERRRTPQAWIYLRGRMPLLVLSFR
jgi:hypothetical protein